MKSWLTRLTLRQWLLVTSPVAAFSLSGILANPGTAWQSVSGLAFSPDGKKIAIGVYCGRFRRSHERWYFADLVHTVALAMPSAHGPPTILGSDHRRGTLNMLPDVFIGPSVAFSSDGKLLASTAFGGQFNGAFTLWNAATGRRISQRSTRQPHVRCVAWLPGRPKLVTSFRYCLEFREGDAESPPSELEVGMNVRSLAFAPRGGQIAVGSLTTPEIEFWDYEQRTLIGRLGLSDDPTGSVTSMGYTPDGKTLLVADNDGVKFVDVIHKRVTASVRERLVLALAVSPDGRRFATGRYDGLTLWNLPSHRKTSAHWNLPAVESVQFSPDGHLLAAGASDGSVHVFNVDSGELIWSWTIQTGEVTEILRTAALATFVVWVIGWPIDVARRQLRCRRHPSFGVRPFTGDSPKKRDRGSD